MTGPGGINIQSFIADALADADVDQELLQDQDQDQAVSQENESAQVGEQDNTQVG